MLWTVWSIALSSTFLNVFILFLVANVPNTLPKREKGKVRGHMLQIGVQLKGGNRVDKPIQLARYAGPGDPPSAGPFHVMLTY